MHPFPPQRHHPQQLSGLHQEGGRHTRPLRLPQGRLPLLAVLFVVLALPPFSATASFLQAPHDATNGLSCQRCHQESFSNPTGHLQNTASIDDTTRNSICLSCHGPDGSAPGKGMHSSLALESRHPDWTTQCVDCHDPHFQSQLQYVLTAPERLFLVQGNVADLSSTDGRTVLHYNELRVNRPEWATPSGWSKKSGSGRGLILVVLENGVPATGNSNTTAEVAAADERTITLEGILDPAARGKGFALIYGMLLRDRVRRPGGTLAPVRFFTPGDGFTGSAGTEGICQVCHTRTSYWNRDRVVENEHNAGSRCTSCHLAANGFRPTFPDHGAAGYVTPVAPCTSCHSETDTIAGIHSSRCSHCHTQVPALKVDLAPGPCTGCHTLEAHDTALAHDHRANTGLTADCSGCHATAAATAVDTLHGDCLTCHASSLATVVSAIAAGRAGADVNCDSCHTGASDGAMVHPTTVLAAAALHDNLAASFPCVNCHAGGTAAERLGLHPTCTTCHASSLAAVAAAIDAGKGGTPATCVDCHGHHPHHASPHAAAGDCTWCHPDPRPEWAEATPGDNGGTSPRPTQLACSECHVRIEGSTVYIDKLTYTNDGNPPARTVRHTIDGVTAGYIHNYGMCFHCHNGTAAPAVKVWHAKPEAAAGPRFDLMANAPGKGKFNIFWDSFHREDAVRGKTYLKNLRMEYFAARKNELLRQRDFYRQQHTAEYLQKRSRLWQERDALLQQRDRFKQVHIHDVRILRNTWEFPADGYRIRLAIPCTPLNGCSGSASVPVLPARPAPVVE